MEDGIPKGFKEYVKTLSKENKKFLESLFDEDDLMQKKELDRLNSLPEEEKYWLLYKGWINILAMKYGSFVCGISIFELIENYKDISKNLKEAKENEESFEDECIVFDEKLNPIFTIRAC